MYSEMSLKHSNFWMHATLNQGKTSSNDLPLLKNLYISKKKIGKNIKCLAMPLINSWTSYVWYSFALANTLKKRITVCCSKVGLLRALIHLFMLNICRLMWPITSPLSSTAIEQSWPQAMLTTTLFCRQLLTRRGVGWLAVDPEPTWPELL